MKQSVIQLIAFIILGGLSHGKPDSLLGKDVSKKAEQLLELKTSEVAGIKFVGDAKISKQACYAGSVFVTPPIEFELFPDLSLFRIRLLSKKEDDSWLYINHEFRNPDKDALMKKSGDGGILIEKQTEVVVLACGSGLAKSDVTAAKYSCAQTNIYYIYQRQFTDAAGKKMFAKILIDNLGNVLCYNIFGLLWKEPE